MTQLELVRGEGACQADGEHGLDDLGTQYLPCNSI